MMTCQSARRYLYAFADGELSVRENCEVLDHLKMCPECTRLADEHQFLRSAVRHVVEAEAVPTELAARIGRMMHAGTAAPRRPRRIVRWLAPLAAAASIVIAAASAWRTLVVSRRAVVLTTPAPVVDRSSSAASSVVRTHQMCCEHHAGHHLPGLPRALPDLRRALSQHFDGAIQPLAPDLDSRGYRFESANVCQITPGVSAGHVIYVNADGRTRLSFFSAPRWECIEQPAVANTRERTGYSTFSVEEQNGDYAVVAWHDERTSYICCCKAPVEDMLELVKPVLAWTELLGDQYALLWLPSDR